MGSIKHQYLKRAANSLMETYPDEFGMDFYKNKEKVRVYCSVTGKSIRNKITGYITHVMKKKASED